ncbi:MAG: hypothetical protein ACI84K_000011 [Pseudohongiellaceae bacterium]
MDVSTKQKIAKSLVGLLIAIFLFFSAGLKIPVLDAKTDAYFQEAITSAGLAYATTRAINASVSVIKESNLQLEPAGVGVSIAVGQIVDPIDDMTERLSLVLVTAITSLGVQKLAYEISVSLAPQLLAICLFLLSIFIWCDNKRVVVLQSFLVRGLLIVAIVRFCLPVSSLANEYLYEHHFSDQITQANKTLSFDAAELDSLQEFSLPEVNGFFGTIENSAVFLKRKSNEFKAAVTAVLSRMGEKIDNLLTLTFLYVGVFLIQVIILPLLSFWFLMRLSNAIFQNPPT